MAETTSWCLTLRGGGSRQGSARLDRVDCVQSNIIGLDWLGLPKAKANHGIWGNVESQAKP